MIVAIEGDTTRNIEAEEVYRRAWTQYGFAVDGVARGALEKVMDDAQLEIAFNPADPRWQLFIDTLPGFREHWDGLRDASAEMFIKAFGVDPREQR